MSLYSSLLRPLLFRLDPEQAHNLALSAVSKGMVRAPGVIREGLRQTLFGVEFPNPIGLAAGFDKNGEAISHWKDLGFGFVEVGTVTRHPQPGNPKPRMFRLPEQKGLINRLGFNNLGAAALAKKLERAAPGIPVGINLGKSKVTPLEEAAEDYAWSFQQLKDFGAYFVVNVSSPNTPGLRQLQDRDSLSRILWRLKEIDSQKPLFVKLAPDLSPEQLDDAVDVALEFGLTGVVAGNTTLDRSMLPADPGIEGGLSGLPLRAKADEMLARTAARAAGRLVLIGVGGIMNAADASRKLALGASLVQVYTGWVYGGPSFVSDLAKGIELPPKALPSHP